MGHIAAPDPLLYLIRVIDVRMPNLPAVRDMDHLRLISLHLRPFDLYADIGAVPSVINGSERKLRRKPRLLIRPGNLWKRLAKRLHLIIPVYRYHKLLIPLARFEAKPQLFPFVSDKGGRICVVKSFIRVLLPRRKHLKREIRPVLWRCLIGNHAPFGNLLNHKFLLIQVFQILLYLRIRRFFQCPAAGQHRRSRSREHDEITPFHLFYPLFPFSVLFRNTAAPVRGGLFIDCNPWPFAGIRTIQSLFYMVPAFKASVLGGNSMPFLSGNDVSLRAFYLLGNEYRSVLHRWRFSLS